MEEPDKIIKDAMPSSDGFSFVETAGSLIQNTEFSSGFKNFQTSVDPNARHDTFVYTILSSIADDVGETLYNNIRRYVDYVSNVDVCKVKALKSMLKLFGFRYTVFDDFDKLPLEILDLLNVLSIEKRYLLKSGILKPEFLEKVLEYSLGEHASDWKFQKCVNFRDLMSTNSYIISGNLRSSDITDSRKIIGTYTQLRPRQAKNILSTDIDADVFVNSYGYRLISADNQAGIYTPTNDQLMSFDNSETRARLAQLSSCCQSALFKVSDLSGPNCIDATLLSANKDLSVAATLTCFGKEDLFAYDQAAYESFVEDLFFDVLSGYLALPYNTKSLELADSTASSDTDTPVYIYPQIQDEYFGTEVNTGYSGIADNQILSVKAFYHIPTSFDEKVIVDNIDLGDDSLDNYSGIQLSIILNEIQRREASSNVASVKKAVGGNAPQTRYSYYREQKVLEYQKFIDNYFSLVNMDAIQYSVDPNFYLVRNLGSSTTVASLSSVVSRNCIGDPKKDFNFEMIRDVASHLAKVVSYISKLRVKVKQQTQKNYMKGTNLLFVYIINEWLVDYARHNASSLSAFGLSSVYANLSSHQFKSDDDENYTISAVEYYDTTDYTNISTEMSPKSEMSAQVNQRFWESISSTISPMKLDGQTFTLEEIERFYLSTLNLSEPLSGNLQAFLSTLFDLGADPSFMFDLSGDPSLSVFSSKLSSGGYSSEIYERLINLSSSWEGFNDYISGDTYEYPTDKVSDQISNVLETKMFADLSTTYLANVSDVYNANETLVQDLNLHVNSLSTTYLNFISSDYSFYYKKFDSKWCYERFDVDAGAYKHDWYIKNPEYDNSDMTLYEHIYKLDDYSNVKNIVNWALSDVLTYVEDGFKTIYGNLKSQVTSKLSSYGFVDINASTLDKELSYTYDFLNSLIQTGKDDPNLSTYKRYLEIVISLSSDYQPVKEAFTGIFSNPELGMYLVNFIAVSDLTQDNINNLKRYREKTDQSNLQIIRQQINSMYQTFEGLLTERDSIIQTLLDQNVEVTIATGTGIELHATQLEADLLNDVWKKITRANAIINKHKSIINGYVDVISGEISSSLDSIDSFRDVVDEKLSVLNFFEHDTYKKYHQMFLTYGGRDFCYDPYYNIKNQTHPSYQIHPYLWNFVEKLDTQTMVEAGFKSRSVDELEEDLVVQNIGNYVGEFGETLNTWFNTRKGLVDYSGYLSRYEMNNNFLPKVGIVGEVADYDGGFYPPAVDFFNKHKDQCIASISAKATRASVVDDLKEVFPAQLTSYLELSAPADFKEDLNENLVVVGQSLWDDVFKDQVEAYIPDQDGNAILNSYLVGSYLSSVTKTGILEHLEESLEPSFFEKYYKNLGLPTTEYIRIANQLYEYKERISEITLPTSEQDTYDIYKYGVDINGNSYILYKKYDYSDGTSLEKLPFKKKRDTLGEVWIRLNGHPIAFPAFSGANPAYYIFDENRLNPTIWKHLALVDGGKVVMKDVNTTAIKEIDSKMCVFYDFEITKSKTQIAYIAYNPDFPRDDTKQFQRFDLAWVIGSQIQTYYNDEQDLEWLAFLNGSGNNIERIDFRPDSTIYSYDVDYEHLTATSYCDWPALVGYYLNASFEIDFVYLFKRFTLDSATKDLDVSISAAFDGTGQQFFLIKNTNGIQYSLGNPVASNELESIQKRIPVGDEACIAFDSFRQFMSLAFVTTPILSTEELGVKVETSKTTVDFVQNTDGPVLEDPTELEMNSHDYFNQGVTVVEFFRKQKNYIYKKSTTYNLNADISYIPNYPGHDHEVHAYSLYPNTDQHAVELLGASRDIDKYANLVNPSPDPYFDYESIMNNEVFGRVYEDYDPTLDKSYRYLVNPLLGSNSPEFAEDDWKKVTTTNSEIHYKIKLANLGIGESKYSERDLNNIQVLIANPENLGKNPYAMCPLTELSNGAMLFYTSKDSDVVDTKISVDVKTSTEEYFAVGTPTSIKQKAQTSVNRFTNIESISAKYTHDLGSSTADLEFVFKIEDPARPASIDSGTFNVLLHNSKDLTMFKFYHLLDAYGVVNCKYLVGDKELIDIPDDGRGWGIYYDKKAIDDGIAPSSVQSYYTTSSNIKTWLKDIELSAYDYLSDVYILSGYKGLGFKYDEELRFDVSSDLYYYPTLNLKYPKSIVNYVDTNSGYSSKGALSVLDELFGERNLFILNLEDPKEIADKIGKIAIPITMNDTEDIRVYEDWLDYGEGDLSDLHNYEIYSKDDSRVCKFLHFCGEIDKNSRLEISDDWWLRKPLSACLANCEDSLSVVPLKSEEVSSDYTSQWTTVKIDHTTVDLSQFLKLYANYKKNSDNNTIDLYFNYFNWLDSPYIKLVGTKQYVDTIDSTYLKLKSGEDGILDIIVQVKYFSDKKLCGYRNLKVLSYHIWNISDDKPKFVVKKAFEIQKDSQLADAEKTVATISIQKKNVALGDFANNGTTLDLRLATNKELLPGSTIFLDFPRSILELENGIYSGYTVGDAKDDEDDEDGLKKIVVSNTIYGSYTLKFTSKLPEADLEKYKNQSLAVSIYEALMFDKDGNPAEFQSQDGWLMFV